LDEALHRTRRVKRCDKEPVRNAWPSQRYPRVARNYDIRVENDDVSENAKTIILKRASVRK